MKEGCDAAYQPIPATPVMCKHSRSLSATVAYSTLILGIYLRSLALLSSAIYATLKCIHATSPTLSDFRSFGANVGVHNINLQLGPSLEDEVSEGTSYRQLPV